MLEQNNPDGSNSKVKKGDGKVCYSFINHWELSLTNLMQGLYEVGSIIILQRQNGGFDGWVTFPQLAAGALESQEMNLGRLILQLLFFHPITLGSRVRITLEWLKERERQGILNPAPRHRLLWSQEGGWKPTVLQNWHILRQIAVAKASLPRCQFLTTLTSVAPGFIQSVCQSIDPLCAWPGRAAASQIVMVPTFSS